MGRPAKHGDRAYSPKPLAYPPELSPFISLGQYRRGPDDQTWSATFTLRTGKKVVSLGKVPALEASLKAVSLYHQLQDGTAIKAAETDRPKVFKDAAIVAADRLEARYRETLKRFGTSKAAKFSAKRSKILDPLLPALGEVPFSEIKTAARKWLPTYRLQNGNRPAAGTVGNISAALRYVCEIGAELGLMDDDPASLPRLKKSDFSEGEREASFTKMEMQRLAERLSDEWVAKTDSTNRRMMRAMVALLATAGLRPGIETNAITEDQIIFDDGAILVDIRSNQGKYKKPREAVAREDDVFDIGKLLKDLLVWRRANWIADANIDATSIFANPKTGRVPQLDDTFKAALIEFKMLMCPTMKKPRVLYSLRHYCITVGVVTGLTDQELSLIYGTSSAMIQRYYSHARTREIAPKIAGRERAQVLQAARSQKAAEQAHYLRNKDRIDAEREQTQKLKKLNDELQDLYYAGMAEYGTGSLDAVAVSERYKTVEREISEIVDKNQTVNAGIGN